MNLLEAIDQFEITVSGGFAIVTALMWLFWFVVGVITIYQSKLLKPIRKFINSVLILVKPRKQRNRYNNLYANGYIYKWSMKLCMKKWDRGI